MVKGVEHGFTEKFYQYRYHDAGAFGFGGGGGTPALAVYGVKEDVAVTSEA